MAQKDRFYSPRCRICRPCSPCGPSPSGNSRRRGGMAATPPRASSFPSAIRMPFAQHARPAGGRLAKTAADTHAQIRQHSRAAGGRATQRPGKQAAVKYMTDGSMRILTHIPEATKRRAWTLDPARADSRQQAADSRQQAADSLSGFTRPERFDPCAESETDGPRRDHASTHLRGRLGRSERSMAARASTRHRCRSCRRFR